MISTAINPLTDSTRLAGAINRQSVNEKAMDNPVISGLTRNPEISTRWHVIAAPLGRLGHGPRPCCRPFRLRGAFAGMASRFVGTFQNDN